MVRSFGATALYDYAVPDIGRTIRADTKGRLRHALDCISDRESTQCCYDALGRAGGRDASLEVIKAEWRTREAIRQDFVMSLEGTGLEIALDGEYKRPASSEKRQVAAKMFLIFQQLLNDKMLKTHPVEVVGSGLSSVIEGIATLKSGLVSGKKLVVQV